MPVDAQRINKQRQHFDRRHLVGDGEGTQDHPLRNPPRLPLFDAASIDTQAVVLDMWSQFLRDVLERPAGPQAPQPLAEGWSLIFQGF